jgi:hypothetical protein
MVGIVSFSSHVVDFICTYPGGGSPAVISKHYQNRLAGFSFGLLF